jgi:lactoylglutathione lyase
VWRSGKVDDRRPGGTVRTLHFGLRVSDRLRALAFYEALGYQIVGEVPDTGMGHLTMIRLPEDEFVTIELVHDPSVPPPEGASGFSHFVIGVTSLDGALAELAAHGIDAEAPTSPDGSAQFRTTWIVDPDGNRIELVQWPPGHADGITAADWSS